MAMSLVVAAGVMPRHKGCSAAERRQSIARDVSPWVSRRNGESEAPKGRQYRAGGISIPDVPFIVFDVMTFQEGEEFFLKTPHAMVFVLACDVCLHLVQVGLAYAKGAVAGLPREGAQIRACLMDPGRGIALDVTDHIGNRRLFSQRYQEMHVVRHSACGDQDISLAAANAGDVFSQPRGQGAFDKRFAILRAEDHVTVHADEGLGHRATLRGMITVAPCGAARPCYAFSSQGLAPLAIDCRPSGTLVPDQLQVQVRPCPASFYKHLDLLKRSVVLAAIADISEQTEILQEGR